MADFWHPIGRIFMSDIGEKIQNRYVKVIFESDISLRTTTMRRTILVSCWVGEADGPVCRNLDKKSGDNGHNGPRIEVLNQEPVNQLNMGYEVDNRASNVLEPMDLILEGENDPFYTMGGKKRQYLVGPSSRLLIKMLEKIQVKDRLALLCGAVESNENSKLERS
ncbi:hypothetical protein J1N35_044986 [Gossypium stocksii]|uniref:DUF4283 domain-containing protein n=1 Tax=Gossypium stocksii TaxID=47602 RepID=A0A9D3ZGR9_9ROSI|nr:hypothetical protein J1N35_044986 [Gossypium stocksii]